jgi:hypothetical protein
MLLVATLCSSRAEALKILREVPRGSVVLLPESIPLIGQSLVRISKEKVLFIIYNSDIKIGDKLFITMKGMDKGKEVWRVRKFRLWKSDYTDGFSPSEPEPFVTLRGR